MKAPDKSLRSIKRRHSLCLLPGFSKSRGVDVKKRVMTHFIILDSQGGVDLGNGVLKFDIWGYGV